MYYSSNKGLLSKQTAHPLSTASPVHTATKERTENSLLQVTRTIDSADQVACGTLHWWGLQRDGCGMTQPSSLITVAGKVASRRVERETKTNMCRGLFCPVLNVKIKDSSFFLDPMLEHKQAQASRSWTIWIWTYYTPMCFNEFITSGKENRAQAKAEMERL